MPRAFEGTIIRNQMVLRANPDDDEEEGEEIDRVVREWAPRVEAELQARWRYVTDGQPSVAVLRERLDSAPAGTLREVLEEMLRESSHLGVQVAVRGLHQVGVSFNWQLANSLAAEWASRYSFELIRRIDAVTSQQVAGAVASWVEHGGSWNDLVARLAPWFGEERARRIATTEATRAYAEGTFDGYERAGFGPRPAEENRPPAHVNCRCWVGLRERGAGEWEYVWFTARDELVCPICQPRHLRAIGAAGRI